MRANKSARWISFGAFSRVYSGTFGDSNFVEPVSLFVRDSKVTKVEGGWLWAATEHRELQHYR